MKLSEQACIDCGSSVFVCYSERPQGDSETPKKVSPTLKERNYQRGQEVNTKAFNSDMLYQDEHIAGLVAVMKAVVEVKDLSGVQETRRSAFLHPVAACV